MSRIHRIDIQARFGDTDALGHVNNAAFASYAELGRLHFLRPLGTFVGSIILASLTIDFRRQVKFDEPLQIETWISSIGRSSMTLSQVLWVNGERAAEYKSVVVHFDYASGKSKPWTDEMRAAMAEA